MILDTSALIAIFQNEPEADAFLEFIVNAQEAAISAVSLVETGIVLSFRKGKPMQASIDTVLHRLQVGTVAFTDEHRIEALNAHWRFGKGRHRAGLNFGDCIAYATAQVACKPLLFKGDDFAHTDITPVRADAP